MMMTEQLFFSFRGNNKDFFIIKNQIVDVFLNGRPFDFPFGLENQLD
jgi:hypothetical protein